MIRKWYHVRARSGELLGRIVYGHHAAALAQIAGRGSTIVFDGEIVYTTPPDARYSMDAACEVGDELLRKRHGKGANS